MNTEDTITYENNVAMEQETSPVSQMNAMSPIPVLPQLSVALSLLVFVFGVTYVGASKMLTTEKTLISDIRVETLPAATPQSEKLTLAQAFHGVEVGAESAIVWDVAKQRVLFNKNADEVRPLASITKLMTALISYELLPQNATIPITMSALQVEGDSGFSDGERFTREKLTDLTLIESSNDGAAALGAHAGTVIGAEGASDEVFVHAMNMKAEELGFTRMHFANSTGLDLSESEAGAYGTAREVALLMEYVILHARDAVARTTLSDTRIANKDGAYYEVTNTNTITDELEGLIASKTGYTALSGGNLVVAVNVGLNRPIIVTVLGSSQEGRFEDTLLLVEKARAYITQESE